VRLGLNYVRGLREAAAQALVRERSLRPFTSIHDLTRRVPELRKDELTTLAEIGALNSIGNSPQSHRATEKTKKAANPYLDPVPFEVCHPSRGEELALSLPQGPAFSQPSPQTQVAPPNMQSAIRNLKSPSAPNLQSAISNLKSPFSWEPSLSAVEGCLCCEKSSTPFHRRDALWQVERAVRAAGPLLDELPEPDTKSPLAQMKHEERLIADFHGTGLTVGPHAMAYRRPEMQALGIRPACALKSLPNGQRLRIGGCVITRQRPGTAKGFLFLTLEDETGVANAIVHPDLLHKNRMLLISERFLMVEGILQNQDNVISVKAERVFPLFVTQAETSSHDFH
jgi:DNA polymerase III alpha subunit